MKNSKQTFSQSTTSLSAKSSLLYGASAGSNIYFLLFGVTFKHYPLMFFQFFVFALTIFFTYRFVTIRKLMGFENKSVMKETVGLFIPIIISIVIGLFTVKLEFKDGDLSSIANDNLLFGFLNLVLVAILATFSAKKTKRWTNMVDTVE